jgi:hypothetical protein
MPTASSFRMQRNARALARLERSLPAVFPRVVLQHALARPFIPPTPRAAIESYWRHHSARADRLARALATMSTMPAGWRWRPTTGVNPAPRWFRAPPAPFREEAHAKGPGFCCVCGQRVFRYGWHRDLWGAGPNRNCEWHACCVAAWNLWNAPSTYLRQLKALQNRRCRLGGDRLLAKAEVDHRIPLFKVWRDYQDTDWPALLDFWGVPNLQVINRTAHLEKCGAEAGERSTLRGR